MNQKALIIKELKLAKKIFREKTQKHDCERSQVDKDEINAQDGYVQGLESALSTFPGTEQYMSVRR